MTIGISQAASSIQLSTSEVQLDGDAHIVGDLIGVELASITAAPISWSGGGTHALLHTQGQDTPEYASLASDESTPVDERIEFNEFQLYGGEWTDGYRVLIGPTDSTSTNVDVLVGGAISINAGAMQPLAPAQEFDHEIETLTIDPSFSISWSNIQESIIRIDGNFIVSAWSADMILGDSESSKKNFPSGTNRIDDEGPQGTAGASATNEERVNTLTVEDGWIEIRVPEADTQHVFTGATDVTAKGLVSALKTSMMGNDDEIAEGDLVGFGPVEFQLEPSGADALAIQPSGESTSWTFNGAPIFDDDGNALDAQTIIADPSEGQWPTWTKALSWVVVGLAVAAALELTGVSALGRAKFNLATFRYERVKAQAYWMWFPTAIRARMYFNAAIAAAGREDHQAALEYAASVPASSRWNNSAKFIATQSMAAVGYEASAEFALAELTQADPRYQALAAENPFLRHLVTR